MAKHQEIRQKLAGRYAEIQHRLEKITNDANKPLDADFEEQAVERENDEVLDALDSSIRAEMAQIELKPELQTFFVVSQKRFRLLVTSDGGNTAARKPDQLIIAAWHRAILR
jgi:DnaK suppressor DksA-like protein